MVTFERCQNLTKVFCEGFLRSNNSIIRAKISTYVKPLKILCYCCMLKFFTPLGNLPHCIFIMQFLIHWDLRCPIQLKHTVLSVILSKLSRFKQRCLGRSPSIIKSINGYPWLCQVSSTRATLLLVLYLS